MSSNYNETMQAAGLTVADYRALSRRIDDAIGRESTVRVRLLRAPLAPDIGEPLIDPAVTIRLVAVMRSGDRHIEIPLALVTSIEEA